LQDFDRVKGHNLSFLNKGKKCQYPNGLGQHPGAEELAGHQTWHQKT
jgi:hypothetical protein